MSDKKAHLADDCLKAIKSGMTISEASRKFKVSRATIYTWQKSKPKAKAQSTLAASQASERQGATVSYHPRTKLYPTAPEQIAALTKEVENRDRLYAELMQVSKEEILELKDSVDFLVNCLKEAMTRKLKPKAGGWPDFSEAATGGSATTLS